MAHAVTVDAELRADGVGSSTNAVFVFFEKVAVAGPNNDSGEEKSECTRIQNASENGETRVKMAKHGENGKTR